MPKRQTTLQYKKVKRARYGVRGARKTTYKRTVRRLGRRRRQGRRSRRTGRVSGKYLSGIYAKLQSSEALIDIGPLGDVDLSIDYTANAVQANAAILAQFTGYAYLYDQVKILKVTREVWLTDNDELSKPDTRFTRLHSVYDPDATGRFMTYTNIDLDPSHRDVIMVPGKKYRFPMTPRWALKNNNANSPALYNYTGYMDVSDVQTGVASGVSSNRIHIKAVGPEEVAAITSRFTLELHFRKRRQGTQYV